MYWTIPVFLISFFMVVFSTPILIRKLRAAGIVGIDIHKGKKVKVPEMGGLIIVFGFSTGLFLSIPFFTNNLVSLFAAFSTILIMGLIGVCDDIFGIKHRRKALLPLFASIPLIAIQAGVHTMIVPFIGLVDFGILYPLILIPFGLTVAANSYNMLAGYNGLEVGLGFIACMFVGINGIIINEPATAAIMFAMAGACLGFLKFNYYPSRLFPGDIGTFVIGSSIAAAVIIGNMEIMGLFVLVPQIVNGAITTFGIVRRKSIQKFSGVRKGILIPPTSNHVNTLYFSIERVGKLTERKLVWIIWSIGIVFGVLGLLYYISFLPV